MKFSLFAIAMMAAVTVNAVPIHSLAEAEAESDADMDLHPRAPASIITSNSCCPTAGCKKARSIFEPYNGTYTYGDKPWLHLPCGPGDVCSKDGKAAPIVPAAAAAKTDGKGSAAADEAMKSVDTQKIAAELKKAL